MSVETSINKLGLGAFTERKERFDYYAPTNGQLLSSQETDELKTYLQGARAYRVFNSRTYGLTLRSDALCWQQLDVPAALGLPTINKKRTKSESDAQYDYYGVMLIGLSPDERCDLEEHVKNGGAASKDFSGKPHTLVWRNSELQWRTALVAAVIVKEVPLVYVNEGYEWLSYESVVNNPQFRRTNQKLDYLLYTIQIDDVDFWVRSGLNKSLLKVLTDACFPDMEEDEVVNVSNALWPWKNAQFLSAALKAKRANQPGARHQNRLKLRPRVVLPYNPYDNHQESLALGTKAPTDKARQMKDNLVWSFWRTASRSCVALLERRKEKHDQWGDVLKQGSAKSPPPWEWPYNKGNEQRAAAKDRVAYKAEIEKNTRLTAAALSANHVSLKTGVCFVGSDDQSWKKIVLDGKDCIDSNWIISCLRSDYVAETNALLKEKGYNVDPASDRLVVLTELLTVVERAERDDSAEHPKHGKFRDGVQVRDLSILVKERVYVFPGSIPFLAPDHKSLVAATYASRDNQGWCEFWRENWAAALGRTKALAAVRYGLQHINPNPQNYLIELQKDPGGTLKGPARIVIRDLQDAALHREVIWALYGGKGAPPVGGGKHDELAVTFKAHAERTKGTEQRIARMLQYEFESVQDGYQETGSTDVKFGDPGTRLAWWLFSTGRGMNDKGGETLEALKREIGNDGVDKVFQVLGEWGLAHDAAYAQCVEQELGIEIRTIDWTKFPPKKDFKAVEEAAADMIHAELLSANGQTALRNYRNNAWKSPAPTATFELVDSGDKPLAWRTVMFETADGNAKWSRPTDAQGRILLFGVKPVAEVARLHMPGAAPKDLVAVNGTKWRLP